MIKDTEQLEETQIALAQCLGKLPPPDYDLIRQRYRGDTTNRDVARGSGRSESAISRALNRIYMKRLLCIERPILHDGAHRQA